ncbi:MAG TPA: hypothetical protein VN948_14795 [Terriglobales bacterium]|nr:hypothetical protein [Terriglobales bacterium]
MKLKDFFLLSLLTLGALLVHGYHPWAEDAEIYLPGVEKILHPELFPFNAQFFESHARLTFFPNFIAASVRVSHLPLDVVLLFWQLTSIFLLLLACWQLISKCFADQRARWAGVATVAALLTLPVAGTALYIMDQYINPRNLAAFAAIFAIAKVVDGKYFHAGFFLVFAAAIHPLMSVFVLSYCAVLLCIKEFDRWFASLGCLLPFGISFEPPSPAYHQVALSHSYFYLLRWHWYEWLGVVAPMVLLWWFSRVARSQQLRNLNLLCRALIVYEFVYLLAGVLLSIPARFESLARFQPMRSLYVLYVLFFLFAGALLGEYVLRNRVWRWAALFVPLCAGMFLVQRALFPASADIEWPGAAPKNQWVQAFDWIRTNTPRDAVFALDPFHMNIPGEDANGFRAIAQRSMLADAVKDSGAVSMFPPMAEEWLEQVQSQSGWKTFQSQDFRRLQAEYGVNWVVLQQPGAPGLDCPYQNAAVLVCRVN